MKVGYARVSTEDQNLSLQLDALEAAGCEKIFRDDGVSGARTDRPGLNEALAALQPGDVLTVWRLDRLGRSLPHLVSVVHDLGNRGIGFQSLTEAINTATSGGKLVFHIMGALAEFERELISERCKAGMRAAKKRGKHIGRPPALSPEQMAHASQMIAEGRETISGMAALLGIARGNLSKALKRREQEKRR